MPDSEKVEISLLHLKGPTKSFKYPPEGDILVMSHHDILTIINPSTATGQVYTLTQEEMDLSAASLASRYPLPTKPKVVSAVDIIHDKTSKVQINLYD